MMNNDFHNNMIGQATPQNCCTGTEVFCLSIPAPFTLVINGVRLNIELPCLRITSIDTLTAAQASNLQRTVTGILGGLGTGLQK